MNLSYRSLSLFFTIAVLIGISAEGAEGAEGRSGGVYIPPNDRPVGALLSPSPSISTDHSDPDDRSNGKPFSTIHIKLKDLRFEIIYEENGKVALDLKESPLQGKFSNVIKSFEAFHDVSSDKNVKFDEGNFHSEISDKKDKIKYTILAKNHKSGLTFLVPINNRLRGEKCIINDVNRAVNDLAYIDSRELLLCATRIKLNFNGKSLDTFFPLFRKEVKDNENRPNSN